MSIANSGGIGERINQRLKLLGAAILAFRATMSLQAARATWPWRSAAETRVLGCRRGVPCGLAPEYKMDLSQTTDTSCEAQHSRTPAGTPSSPPGYELRDEIGRGGMGVVYRARDTALERDVAVKLLAERYS